MLYIRIPGKGNAFAAKVKLIFDRKCPNDCVVAGNVPNTQKMLRSCWGYDVSLPALTTTHEQ